MCSFHHGQKWSWTIAHPSIQRKAGSCTTTLQWDCTTIRTLDNFLKFLDNVATRILQSSVFSGFKSRSFCEHHSEAMWSQAPNLPETALWCKFNRQPWHFAHICVTHFVNQVSSVVNGSTHFSFQWGNGHYEFQPDPRLPMGLAAVTIGTYWQFCPLLTFEEPQSEGFSFRGTSLGAHTSTMQHLECSRRTNELPWTSLFWISGTCWDWDSRISMDFMLQLQYLQVFCRIFHEGRSWALRLCRSIPALPFHMPQIVPYPFISIHIPVWLTHVKTLKLWFVESSEMPNASVGPLAFVPNPRLAFGRSSCFCHGTRPGDPWVCQGAPKFRCVGLIVKSPNRF